MSEREEFEMWAKGRFYLDRIGGKNSYSDEYANDATYAAWAAWQGARTIAQSAIPEGWQLVPVDPTESMRLAPAKDRPGFSRNVAAEIYRSMLAAAPQPSKKAPK